MDMFKKKKVAALDISNLLKILISVLKYLFLMVLVNKFTP